MTPQERRELLISQAKRDREHKAKISALCDRKLGLLRRKGGDDDAELNAGDSLNEVEETLIHHQIHLAATQAFCDIRSINKELPLLERMAELQKNPKTQEEERQKYQEFQTKVRFCFCFSGFPLDSSSSFANKKNPRDSGGKTLFVPTQSSRMKGGSYKREHSALTGCSRPFPLKRPERSICR